MRTYTTTTCTNCGKEITFLTSTRKRSKHYFCSMKCNNIYKKARTTKKGTHICSNCKQQFEATRMLSSKKVYCSRECFNEARRQKEHVKQNNSTRPHLTTKRTQEAIDRFEKYKRCYMKEARALLKNKNWKGKNKCTQLPGDENDNRQTD